MATQERDGRNLIYRAAYDHMDALLGFMVANCSQGDTCLEADATVCNKC